MKVTLNVEKYFKGNLVAEKAYQNTPAVSHVIPDVLSDMFPDLHVLFIDKNIKCLSDKDDRRWKVWCSRDNVFDIAPSFTKGAGRDKQGTDVLFDAKEKYDGFIFVSVRPEYVLEIRFVDWSNLDASPSGKVVF